MKSRHQRMIFIGAVGLAIINTLLTRQSEIHYSQLAEHVNPANPAALDMINNLTANFKSYGMDGSSIAIKQISGMVHQQASLLSFMDVFLILTSLFAALVLMTTMLRILRHTGLVAEHPNLARYQARCEARPAFRRALEAQLAPFRNRELADTV